MYRTGFTSMKQHSGQRLCVTGCYKALLQHCQFEYEYECSVWTKALQPNRHETDNNLHMLVQSDYLGAFGKQ